MQKRVDFKELLNRFSEPVTVVRGNTQLAVQSGNSVKIQKFFIKTGKKVDEIGVLVEQKKP